MGSGGSQDYQGTATDNDGTSCGAAVGALEAARCLRAEMPEAVLKQYGDAEGVEWWERHADLFEEARREWGVLCAEVYCLAPAVRAPPAAAAALASSKWLQPEVRMVLADGSPSALRSVLHEVCRDSAGYAVYQFDLLADEFCDALLSELDHLEASGIPLRRPNGMNRFGAILSQLGFQESLLQPITRHVLAPFARELWPEWVGPNDCDETYGFVVRYKIGEDLDLAEHADSSNVTLNVCLGRAFEGGDIYFKGVRFTGSENDKEERRVGHRKGTALLHLGGHFHGVDKITSGERCNCVLWATGGGGRVRIRPTIEVRDPKSNPLATCTGSGA